MSLTKYKTDHQIRLMKFQALQNELGIVGLIRFMQQSDLGSGDYVKDREAWQKDSTVDTLSASIQDFQHQTAHNNLHSSFCTFSNSCLSRYSTPFRMWGGGGRENDMN